MTPSSLSNKRPRPDKTTTTSQKTQTKGEQRMVLGGKQVQWMLTPEQFTPTQGLKTLLNRKQDSKVSIAIDMAAPAATIQRQIPGGKAQESDRYHRTKSEI